MSTKLHIGQPVIACRPAPACRSRRRALQFGVSLLAIAASLAPAARAQTTVGPGTVTNSVATTDYFLLTGNGGTLINQGTISPPSAVPVQAEISPFTSSELSSYAITGVSLVNSGLLTSGSSNAVTAIGVNGFTINNSGTMTNSAAGFPSLYLNNLNNLQLSNTGLMAVVGTATDSRVANLYDITNSTLVNQGTISVMSVTDSLPALFLSAKSANVTITNGGTISTAGGGQAILVGGSSLSTFNTTIDTTNVVTENPVATNITLNNSGVLTSSNLALTVGGTASAVAMTNSGTITTTSASGTSAITVQNAAGQVSIANTGLVVNGGTGSAIDVSTSGSGVSIGNSGTITELGGNGIAIDHLNGTAPLAINTGGIINGGIRLSQPGDTLGITGGAINGAVIASAPGAGVVTFNAAGGFTTGGDFGTASNPLGGIVIAGGTLNNNNTLTADTMTVGPVAKNVALNNAGVLSSNNVALAVDGFSSAVGVTNSGTITTTSATGVNAISVSGSASQVRITNDGLVVNAGTGSAIDVSTSGAGANIGNTGTITELGGNSIAIDHLNGSAPLVINTSGTINGGIRLSQPGDTLGITGGAINGGVAASNPGAGTVTFNTPGGFTTGGDYGSAGDPLGAIVIASGTLDNGNVLAANSISFAPSASNVTLDNTGVLSSPNLALAMGGTSSVVGVINSGTITTTSASGSNAISVANAASGVSIANIDLVMNAGTGAAIDVSTSGSGVSIGNTGTITELGGTGIAIDHLNGTTPLAISTSGIINGGIRLSQAGDTLNITGGAINGAVTASNPGAGTVTFNAPAGFTTGGDMGTASNPLGAIVIAGGSLTNNNTLTANSIALAPTATNVTLNNSGVLSSNNQALTLGGFASAVGVTNSGTITTTAASGSNAISVANAASGVSIANIGLVMNAGTGAAIDVSTSGTGVSIANTGTITELAGTGIAIDHVNGTAPLAINTSGIINGGIRLSQPGDTLGITGGAINGVVAATNPGAGTVTFNAPGGFTTTNNFGTTSNPLGAIVIGGGGLTNGNTLAANNIGLAPTATNVAVNNTGLLASNGVALAMGGTASVVAVTNTGTITTSASGANAIAVSGAANQVSISNSNLVVNAGTGAAIDVSTSGAGVAISNSGNITELGGNGIAIDHLNGTAPLAINISGGVITGGIRLSQPDDALAITGGQINGAVIASNAGAGTVTFDAPESFTTGGSFGTAVAPLGAIVIGGGGFTNSQALFADSITLAPATANATLDNQAVLSSPNLALMLGGTSSVVGVINSGTITTTAASGTNAIAVAGAASQVSIVNSGLVSNAGTGSAIDVSTSGSGATIGNTGTISELAGNGIAIDHANGTQPLAITSSGIINGAVRLSQPGDTLLIAGGAINGAIVASNPGAGTVTFITQGAFTTGGDIGTTGNPLGAIRIAGGTLNNANLLTANSITVGLTATNVTLNNSGLLSSGNLALGIGGTASGVTVVNTGAILTSAATGGNAIAVSGAASGVSITNIGLVENVGTGSAIDVSTSGTGVSISNTGTITELTGNGIAIDHVNGTAPLAIFTSGIINGGIRLSQPGDTLGITGGAINGAVTASNAGAGTVTFNAPGGFTTGGDFGTAGNPLGAIMVAGGALNLGNALWANSVSLGGGSTTTLLGNVNAVANNGTLNLAGGTLSLGTNTLVLGSNATIRTSTMDGSTINVTIDGSQSGSINARAGNATVDTSANTLIIRPNLVGPIPAPGTQYAVIETSPGANVTNALTKVSIAPGPLASVFTPATATSTQTPGTNIVLTVTGNSATVTNAAAAANDQQISQAQVNTVVTSVTERIGDAVANAIAGSLGGAAPGQIRPGGISGGDEPAGNWSVWTDASDSYLQDTATGAAFDGSIYTVLVGADEPVTDKIIVGAVAGYEDALFTLSSAGGRRTSSGLSITPYAAYILSDWASVDLELSYARLENTITVTAGTPIASNYATNRVFAAGNFSAYWNVDDLTLRGKVGFLIANTGGPTYTNGTGVRGTPPSTTLQEAKLGGEASYHWGQFEPYLNMTLEDDLHGAGDINTAVTGISSPSRYGLDYDAGLRYKTERGIQVGVHAGGETLRGTQSTIMGGLFARIPL